MAQLKDTTINDTGFVRIPAGTTSQRPIPPEIGDFRYNTDEGYFEVWDGNGWQEILGVL